MRSFRAAIAPGADDVVKGFGNPRVIRMGLGPGDGDLAEPSRSRGKIRQGFYFVSGDGFFLWREKTWFRNISAGVNLLRGGRRFENMR